MQRFCKTAWLSKHPSKACSEMLHGLEVVQTHDIAQALNQTVQVQPFEVLLGLQVHPIPTYQIAAVRDNGV